jgi:hypothetical protein
MGKEDEERDKLRGIVFPDTLFAWIRYLKEPDESGKVSKGSDAEDGKGILINRLTLANLVLNLLQTRRVEDLIPHIGVFRGGEIRKGISGKGPAVEGYINPDPDMPQGQKVLYRADG